MRSPDSDRVIWVTNNHLISTNPGDPFSWDPATVVDLTVFAGWGSGVVHYAVWWEGAENGAGRYYIYTSLDVWWESADAVTWAVSTNPQFTVWDDVEINSGKGTGRFCIYRGSIGGMAFVHNNKFLVFASP